MNQPQTRLLTFAGSSLTLEYGGDAPASVVDFLYGQVPADTGVSPHLTFRLFVDEQGQFCAYRGENRLYQGDSPAELADRLLGNTCHHLADKSQGGLLFHAGALAWQDRGVILPGTMGAGKTTLTAWLLTKGFNYLSDELVFIPTGGDIIHAFPRPLNLKRPSRSVLEAHLDFSAENAQIFNGKHIDLVPPELLNPTTRFSQPSLNLIIFPRYQTDSQFILAPLSKAQTGKALMQCLVNARNLPELGFSEITRLARRVPAYQMQYSSFEQVGDMVERLLGE